MPFDVVRTDVELHSFSYGISYSHAKLGILNCVCSNYSGKRVGPNSEPVTRRSCIPSYSTFCVRVEHTDNNALHDSNSFSLFLYCCRFSSSGYVRQTMENTFPGTKSKLPENWKKTRQRRKDRVAGKNVCFDME